MRKQSQPPQGDFFTRDIGKVMQSGTVQQEMLTEATETKQTFISHFCDIKS
jgi:hypothetical protein